MYSELEERYLALRAEVYVHRFPYGGLLISQKSVVPGREMEKWYVQEVDDDFIEFVKLADGTHTLSEIKSILRKEGLSDEQIIHSLETGLWSKVLRFSENKHESLPMFVGSNDYYVPLHIHLELTSWCNFRCAHCYRSASPASGAVFIDFDKVKPYLKEIAEKGTKIIELTGGEPLGHPKIREIIDFCVANFSLVVLLTNGYLIDDSFIKFVKSYANRRSLLVASCIYSVNESYHDRFTGVKGSWKRTLENVKKLSEEGVITRLGFVYTPETMDEVEKFGMLAEEIGPTLIQPTPAMPIGRGSMNISWKNIPVEKEIQTEKMMVCFLKNYKNTYTASEDALDPFLNKTCGAGYLKYCIGPDGGVRPCPYMPEGLCNLGNLFEEGLTKVFSHPLIRKISEIIAPSPKTCYGCALYRFCGNCWYRGLIGSRIAGYCGWEKIYELSDFVDKKMLESEASAIGENL